MRRITEPELMDDPAQAAAYAEADFTEAHARIVAGFEACFPRVKVAGRVLDLGCGPGDISFRFASRHLDCTVIGVDGSAAMIALARKRLVQEPSLAARVQFIESRLPDATLPAGQYSAIISNSLLHHLHRPAVLWETVAAHACAGTYIYIVDLLRPQTTAQARRLVDVYAAGEPDVLRRDFYHSLCAAFEPAEVEAQLAAANLAELSVSVISDRHLAVYGIRC
jgi:SAM-dependent methyltransferase